MGNKNDAPDKKVISSEDARKFAETMHIELYEASAKDNINVEEVRWHTTHTHTHVRMGASRHDVTHVRVWYVTYVRCGMMSL